LKNIAVIGTGVIGTGWILRFLANGIKVKAFDKNYQQINFLKKEITRTNLIIKKLYKTKIPRNITLAESPSHGLPVLQYDSHSKGSISYMSLAGEILKQENS